MTSALLALLWLCPPRPARAAQSALADAARQACAAGLACVDLPPAPKLSPPAPPKRPVDFSSVRLAAADFQSTDPHLATLFRGALGNVSKQASWQPDGTVYVKTGDIPAEWLRDSSAQVRPLLFFAQSDPQVREFLRGVIARQAGMLAADPYANAFRADYSVWEEKFELDSLLYPIDLAWAYWKVTGDKTAFTPGVGQGFAAALDTMQAEQDHGSAPRRYDHKDLRRNPVGRTGMIWTGFRPSDDPCTYNFHIPDEMMAAVVLGELEELESAVLGDQAHAAQAAKLRQDVERGIESYGVVDVQGRGRIYAYEVDGLGHALLMDDGNIPSLLSAPYLGYGSASDPIYQATRRFLLSPADPYYYAGSKAAGIGSPHTPKGYVWPLALLSQDLTTDDPAQRAQLMGELEASDPGDGRLHESFNPNNPKKFTRKDFGWPNSLFAELVMTQQLGRPPLPRGSAGPAN